MLGVGGERAESRGEGRLKLTGLLSTDRLRIHLDADGFLVKLNPFTSEIKLVRQDFEKKLNTQFEILRPLISSMQAPD
jgi:hypothetical protein